MPSLTSVNIACGARRRRPNHESHIEQALRWKLDVGAHPGYPDRANFGRLELRLPPRIIAESIFEQVRALAEIAATFGGQRNPRKTSRRALQPGSNESRDCRGHF